MKSTWQKEEKTLTVTIDGEAWQEAQEKAFKKLAKDETVPGFRKGKAPEAMLRKQISQQAIMMDAVNEAIQDMYTYGLDTEQVVSVAQPEVDVKSLTNDEMTIEFVLEPYPEVTLDAQYKDLKVEIEEVEVTDDEVDHQIEHLQEDMAQWVLKEEGVIEEGNKVVLDYTGFKGEEQFEGGSAENAELEIGSNSFIPGFEEQLIGVASGESKDLNLTFPEDYPAEDLKGQEVVFKTTVHEIREKVLPELNDEFAKEVDEEEVETLEQLKESVKEKLLVEKQNAAKEAGENKLIEKVIEFAEVDIPQVMIDNESQVLLSEFQQQLSQQGLNFDLYKQILGQTDEDVMAQITPDAQKRVLYRLVMEEVAKQEGLEATDEDVENEYKNISETYQIELEQVKAMAAKEDIAHDVKLKKAVDLLLSR
ncbi:MAG TPA: trigger factor [Erysipelothrix sp.]|jgi:trigger factor|nr:trigger factor [Erysipelothrix sp.]